MALTRSGIICKISLGNSSLCFHPTTPSQSQYRKFSKVLSQQHLIQQCAHPRKQASSSQKPSSHGDQQGLSAHRPCIVGLTVHRAGKVPHRRQVGPSSGHLQMFCLPMHKGVGSADPCSGTENCHGRSESLTSRQYHSAKPHQVPAPPFPLPIFPGEAWASGTSESQHWRWVQFFTSSFPL